MPIYDFKDTTTGEVFEKTMKIAEKSQYLMDNPNLESFISSAPQLIDPVRLGIRKTDQGFKEVLAKIHERNGGGKGRGGSMLGSTTVL